MISGVITNGSYHLAKYRKKTLNDQNRFYRNRGSYFLKSYISKWVHGCDVWYEELTSNKMLCMLNCWLLNRNVRLGFGLSL